MFPSRRPARILSRWLRRAPLQVDGNRGALRTSSPTVVEEGRELRPAWQLRIARLDHSHGLLRIVEVWGVSAPGVLPDSGSWLSGHSNHDNITTEETRHCVDRCVAPMLTSILRFYCIPLIMC